jgi:oxygen-independent coproporphyrinogen-3 oxidase
MELKGRSKTLARIDIFDQKKSAVRLSVPHWYMYPPKQCYLDGPSDSDFEIAVHHLDEPVNLYVHIPFCSMHCSFCTLFTKVSDDRELMSRYIDVVMQQISLFGKVLSAPARILRNIYIGGGTPSILPFSDITRLMRHISEIFDCSHINECSVELSPDAATPEVAAAWHGEGFNRVSLGIQTFNDNLLAAMHRKHDGNSAKIALRTLAASGFTDINADLIYGHPGQTLEDWVSDLEEIVASEASCVTVHPLAVRSSSALGKQFPKNTSSPFYSTSGLMYNACIETLPAAGWKPVGAVFFSRTGRINQLERDEALGFPTLGIGVGARTYLKNFHAVVDHYTGQRSFGDTLAYYIAAIETGRPPYLASLQLGNEERVRRGLILGLMTGGASLCLLEDLTYALGEVARAEIQDTVNALIYKGIVVKSGTIISLSYEGLKHSSDVGYALSSDATRLAIDERRR